MTDYSTIFGTLGAELKNLRKPQAVYEHFHFVDNSDYSKRLVQAEYDATDVYQEAALNLDSRTYDANIAEGARGFLSSMKGIFETSWFPVLDSIISTTPEDKAANAIAYEYDGTLTDGTLSILKRTGRWAALRAQMIADFEAILANTVTFGGVTAVGENNGTLVLTSIAGQDHCLSGLLSFICIDDTVGSQKFTVQNTLTHKLADPTVPSSADGLFSILASDNVLTLGKQFEDGPLGISVKLDQGSPIETDPSNLFSAINVPFSGEADTNKGVIYIRVTRQASDPLWLVQWYQDAALTVLVAQTSFSGSSGTAALSISGTQTLFQATFSMTNAAAAMPSTGNTADFSYNLDLPRLGDQWTIAVTNDEAGNFATKIAHLYRASLNSAWSNALAAATASLVATGTGNVDAGTHSYKYTFIKNGKESEPNATSNVVTNDGTHKQTSLAGVLAGPSGTTARKIYRTVAGNTGDYKYVGTIPDNVTTTFTDNVADSSLGDQALTLVTDSQAASVSMT